MMETLGLFQAPYEHVDEIEHTYFIETESGYLFFLQLFCGFQNGPEAVIIHLCLELRFPGNLKLKYELFSTNILLETVD